MQGHGTNANIRVFVSYTHEDEEWCTEVVKYLKDKGLDPVIGGGADDLGSNWRTGLKEKLDSCHAMVVLFSETSVDRPWVLYECFYGLGAGKKVIFLVQPGVKIPDPISDIQGARITIATYLKEMQKLVDAIRNSAKPEPPLTPAPVPSQLNREALKAVIRRYVELSTNPNFVGIKTLMSTLQENFDREMYLEIFKSEIIENGAKLASPELSRNPDLFLKSHHQQAILGELLSQLVDEEPLYFFKWTEPIVVNGKKIRAAKYLLTRGLYSVEFGGQVSASLHGSGGLPKLVEVDRMSRNSPLERNLLEEIVAPLKWKVRAKLLEMGFNLSDVRLPTPEEWVTLAEPSTIWDRTILGACNLISRQSTSQLSVVGAYPASCSKWGCFDVIGNAWELCRDANDDWFVMGLSHKNTVLDAQNWQIPVPVVGKGVGQDVGLRFVIEEPV